MKHTHLAHAKYALFGLVVAVGIGLVHAAPFNDASTTPPSGGVAVPINMSANDQVKDGGLAVSSFAAAQNAYFDQQVFFKGMVRGGTPANTDSTVVVGDPSTITGIKATGDLSATGSISSSSVANSSSTPLCAATDGTIVLCQPGAGAIVPPPTITENSSVGTPGSTRFEIFRIGSSISPGNKFSFTMFSHTVTVTAVAGDNAEDIVQKLITAINNTTNAQWNQYGSAPVGAVGFPPRADALTEGNGDLIRLTLNYQNSASAYATVN